MDTFLFTTTNISCYVCMFIWYSNLKMRAVRIHKDNKSPILEWRLTFHLSLSVVKGGYNYDIKMLNMLSTSVRNELKAFTPTRIISLLLRVVD